MVMDTGLVEFKILKIIIFLKFMNDEQIQKYLDIFFEYLNMDIKPGQIFIRN
jgi:hypothetical protein